MVFVDAECPENMFQKSQIIMARGKDDVENSCCAHCWPIRGGFIIHGW